MPHPKQILFLQIDDREALYGGAAGGGKSDALLMAFLQHVDQPHYRGLILRRKSVDMERSEAILERAKSWWLPTSKTGVRYFAQKKKFVFPSGATCEFGHANNVGDEEENYQGGAWHFIAFDELTQFVPRQYTYLFSRNRRTEDEVGRPAIPLRIRAASNPGGVSHQFVRDRFMSQDYARQFLQGAAAPVFIQDVGENFRRWFVPAKVSDNLSLDQRSYESSLSQLDPLRREQLLRGDWLIASQGVFRPEWFPRFRLPEIHQTGDLYHILAPGGAISRTVHVNACYRFATLDPAGTSAEKKAEASGRGGPCWSVMSVWDYTPTGELLWRRVVRLQGEFPQVMAAIRSTHQEERLRAIHIETDGIGRPYYQQLASERMPVYPLSSGGKDKLTRATPATLEAEAGRVLIPDRAPWKDDLEAELFAWHGTSEEQCDQIDTLAYAVQLKIDGSLGGDIHLQ